MSTLSTDRIRLAIQAACQSPKDTISSMQLYTFFGLTDQGDKARLRSKVGDMLRRKELVRVSDGVFTYNRKAMDRQAAEGHQRMWRNIRAQGPGWDVADVAQVTRMTTNHVRKYANWLHAEGYIVQHGRRGNSRLWRITNKGRETRVTPIPSRAPSDPFAIERSAACRLVRCMMIADPYRPSTRKKIVTECTTILRRFDAAKEEAAK